MVADAVAAVVGVNTTEVVVGKVVVWNVSWVLVPPICWA